MPRRRSRSSARIADHLCDTAFRHGDRCTWMGMTQDAEDGSDQVDFTYGTLGPDLYGGSSGVALFLVRGLPAKPGPAMAGHGARRDRSCAGPARYDPAARTGRLLYRRSGHRLRRCDDRPVAGALRPGSPVVALLDRLSEAADGDLVADPLTGGTGAIAPLLALASPARPPGVPRSRDAAGPPDGCGRDQKRRRVVMAGSGGNRGLPPAHRTGARGRGHRVVAARAGQRHRRRTR